MNNFSLDIRTTFVFVSIVCATLTIALTLFWKVHREFRGPEWWAIGMGLLTIGLSIFAIRIQWPFFIDKVVSNTLLLGGFAALSKGIRRFYHTRNGVLWEIVPVVSCLFIFQFFQQGSGSLAIRIIIFSFLCSILTFRCSYLLFRNRNYDQGLGQTFASVSAMVLGAALAFRCAISVLGIGLPKTASFFDNNVITTLTLIIMIVTIISLSISLASLPGQRAIAALEGAKLKAEAAANTKSEFLSTVSHELRTPLTSIRGSLGLLDAQFKDQVPEKALPMLDIAVRNVKTLCQLVDDLLDLEKIQSGRLGFHIESVEVGALIAQSKEINQPYAERLGVTIGLDETSPEPLTIHADAQRLSQVLGNLLSNAAKFSSKGSTVVLSWRRHRVERDGNQMDGVRISVTDQGTGIPLEFQSRVFQPFAQADSSASRKVGGTGLGLSICKVIVEHLNGNISFETEEGKGTVFHLDFPISG